MFHFTKSKFKLSNIYLILMNMQEKKLHDLKGKIYFTILLLNLFKKLKLERI